MLNLLFRDMKNIHRFYICPLVLVIALALLGCEKDDETANVSGVTTYAEFQMSGDPYLSIVQGGTFTDPGVTATEGEADLPVSVSGTVDPATPGVYDIVYTAVNSDGFPGSTTRTVAVLPEPEQEGVDISGTYVRSGVSTTVAKLAPGFYLMPNVWGPNLIPSYIITTNGTDLILPQAALSGFGPVEGTGTLSEDGVMALSVSLLNYGIENNAITWERQ